MLTGALSSPQTTSPSAATLATLFAQPAKSTNAASVPEQNRLTSSQQDSVPNGNIRDEFAEVLKQAFGAGAISGLTESAGTVQSTSSSNVRSDIPSKSGSAQTSGATASNVKGDNTSAALPVLQTNEPIIPFVQVTESAPSPVQVQALEIYSQASVRDHEDVQFTPSDSKAKPTSKNDKTHGDRGQAQNVTVPSADGQLPMAVNQPAASIVSPDLTTQLPASAIDLTNSSSAKLSPVNLSIASATFGRNDTPIVAGSSSEGTNVLGNAGSTPDTEAFQLSIRPSNVQNPLTANTEHGVSGPSDDSLPSHPKQLVVPAAQTQKANDLATSASAFEPTLDGRRSPPLTGSSDGAFSGDSNASLSKGISLPIKEGRSVDGEKGNEQAAGPFGASLIASNSNDSGLSTAPVNGKEAITSTQSSAANQPTDLQGTSAGGLAKEVTVRLQGHSGETISIRLSDQGGQVQVAVRSTDALSASSLRQDLSSLTSSLDRIGWKTEVSGSSAGSSNMAGQDSSRSGKESRDDSRSGSPDWEQGSRRSKASTSDIWDELISRKSI